MKKLSLEHRKKLSESKKKAGIRPPSRKGIPHTEKHKLYMSEIMKGRNKGEKNGMWAGETVSILGLHEWISKNYGRPKVCQKCGSSNRRIEWANISGDYKRYINDFIPLCRPCHFKFDNIGEKMWKTRRQNGK
jgi:hypothetical protein